MGTPLIIPSETLTREFDGKLLLGCIAAVRGFRVIVGGKPAILDRLASLPRSIFVTKDLRKGSRRVLDILQRLGHVVVAWDEEGLIYASPEIYHKTRVSPATMRIVERIFAWGEESAQVIRAHPAFPGTPVVVTGNPRIDMLRPELRGYFAEEVAALRERHGEHILVNSNFGYVNHYFEKLNKQASGFVPRPRDREAEAALRPTVQHRLGLFERFLVLVPRLARAFPDLTIVVRPHPSENVRPWREAGAGLPNVVVDNCCSVIPALLAARCMIHNSCTTGVEAAALGRPVIAYRPLVSETLDRELPNAVSHQVFDEAELMVAVRCALDGGALDLSRAAAQRAVLARHVAGLDGPLAAERIADLLIDMDRAGALGAPVPLGRRLSGLALAGRRRLLRLARELQPQTTASRAYLRHKFPGIAQVEVERRVRCLDEAVGGFAALRVREMAEDVFELTA